MEQENRRRKLLRENPATDFREDEFQMGDVYDVIKQAIMVNSPITTMNPDFIMADMDATILDNKFVKYVVDQLNNIEIVNVHLSSEKLQDTKWRIKVNQILLNKVYARINMSRSAKSKVLNAILEYIKRQQGDVQTETTAPEESEPTGLNKLKGLFKGNKKEA